MRSLLPTVALLVSACVAMPPAAAQSGALSAGAARVDITTPASELPFTFARENPMVGVRHPVFARVLVLDDGQTRVALISVEAVKIPQPDLLLDRLAEVLAIPRAHIILSATHTHSTPLFQNNNTPSPAMKREIERVIAGTIAAAEQAAASLQPARIGFGRGAAYVNVNNGELAGLAGGYDPAGPADHTLDVLRVQREDGSPLALVVNYASHAEVMFRSVTRDGGLEITGDLPGVVSQMLEDTAQGIVLFTAGAEGDQNTVLRARIPAGHLPARDLGADGWGILDALASRVAEAALGVVAAMPEGANTAPIHAAAGSAICPGARHVIDRETGAYSVEERPPLSIPLSLIEVGGIELAGIGGDIASEIGTALRSGDDQRMVITVTAGSVGYLLTDAHFQRPGHAVAGSPVAAGCAPAAITNGVALLAAEH